VAVVTERTNDSLARLTIGPAASTIPIDRKIRYTGKNFLRLIRLFGIIVMYSVFVRGFFLT
jgi:hypothetical protein